jgi:hypothetical protein
MFVIEVREILFQNEALAGAVQSFEARIRLKEWLRREQLAAFLF